MGLEDKIKTLDRVTTYKHFLLNNLGDSLKDYIKTKKSFFETTDIVFPSDNVAQWFKAYWLKSESDVLMNINFLTIDECLIKYLDTKKRFTLASKRAIRDLIIKNILLSSKNEFDLKTSSYLYDGDEINCIRLFDLADTLSKLFIGYEDDAYAFDGWQKTLYERVMKELEEQNITSFAYKYKEIGKFSNKNQTIIFFGFCDLDELYFEPLKELSKDNNLIFYLLDSNIEEKTGINLSCAPSKTREIELLHSNICSLVQKENYKYSDFLVLAPNISEYERDITKVFNQDGKSFPNIPFSINDKKTKDTDITTVLKKLFEISTKNFFTRLDFSEIINNKVVQQSRDISHDDIENWQKSIIEMNVFRDGKNIDDWKYAKKRLILSKVSSFNSLDDNIVQLKDSKYIPFTNIDFDDESIIKFIQIVDDLHDWMSEFHKTQFVNEKNIAFIKEQIIKWFSIRNSEEDNENFIVLRLLSELNFWINFGLTNNTIPLNTLFYTLFDVSQETKINASTLFVSGVTFADYDEKSILSAKIIFFIGASSKEFPLTETKSEIDQRPDKNITDLQYEKFKVQCANASDKLYISYVNRDLKTDEEYFPSTLLLKLVEDDLFDLVAEKTIGIDETRKWDELFTKKEYKEKNYYSGLFKNDEQEMDETKTVIPEVMKKVTVSQMKNYLTEPLQYKFEFLYGRVDETNNLIADQYEPISLDNLMQYALIRSVLVYLLKNPECEILDKNGEVDIDLARQIFERFIIEHKIPNINEEIEDINISNVVEEAFNTKEGIVNITNNYEVKKIDDFHFKYNNEDIVLIYNDELCFSDKDGIRHYFELCKSKIVKPPTPYSPFMTMYICSLMDVASLDDETEYRVRLYKGAGSFIDYSICPSKARQILIEIHKNMNSYDLNAFMPIDLVKKNKSFEKMVEKAMSNDGNWRYFKDKKMFNPEKDLGYNKYNYDEKSTEMKQLLTSLVVFITPEEEETE